MKNQRDKSTPEHDAMLTDTTFNHFDRSIIDWKLFEKYRGTTKGPTAH